MMSSVNVVLCGENIILIVTLMLSVFFSVLLITLIMLCWKCFRLKGVLSSHCRQALLSVQLVGFPSVAVESLQHCEDIFAFEY